ncbi:MAG: outer membrane beta-barrel protein [Cruoricaptor ignavus]|nr:outer membrane beta-barrel protein [Cruoricaptor ignavus]
MKKLFLAGALALFGAMNAQEAGFKGKSFIMGQVGFNSSTDNNTDITNNQFAIVPVVGHFVAPTVAIGTGVGYTSATRKFDSDNKTTNSAFVFSPLARKYWGLGEKLYIFGQLAVPMEWGKTKTTTLGNSSESGKYASYGVAIAPGLDYFLNSNWSVEASIGLFGYNNTKPEGQKSTDSFNFGVNTQNLTLGVKYVF